MDGARRCVGANAVDCVAARAARRAAAAIFMIVVCYLVSYVVA